MAKQEFSLAKLAAALGTEADAYQFLEQLRWGGTPNACPHCGGMDRCYYLTPADGTARRTRTGARTERRVWKCGHCRRQFSVLTGTVFHGSKIPVRTWIMVVFEMCASKNGVSAREIERKYEVTPKTAWFMLHRIREAMKAHPFGLLLEGTVVADETWIGGDPMNRHGHHPGEGRRQGGPKTDKTPVLSLVSEETGEVRSKVVPNVTGRTLREAVHEEVHVRATTLYTDGLQSYHRVAEGMKGHKWVDHLAGEYVRDGVSTNKIESFFSQLKRSIDGTHHAVSKEHLPRYLAQFDFLRTFCTCTDSERMRIVIDRAGGRRLSYKPLTAD